MELLVRVRWRHVPAADLRLEVEAYHRSATSSAPPANSVTATGTPVSRCSSSGRATQIALDLPIIESGIVSGDTLRFELYGVDTLDRESLSEAVSCDVTAGPEAGRSFVLLPGRHEVGRGSGLSVRLDDVTVSDHQLSIIVYDDLVTRRRPRPVGDESGRRQRPPGRRGHDRRPQRRRPVRGDCRSAARLQPQLRQRARPARSGSVPAHAVQAGHRPGAGLQAARQHPDQAGAAALLDDHDDPAVGRRADDVRPVPFADVPDHDAVVAAVDGRSMVGQPQDRYAEVRRLDRDVRPPAGEAQGRGRAGAARRARRADPSVARPRRPRPPGDAAHPRPVGAAATATTSSCAPAWASAPWRRRSRWNPRAAGRTTSGKRRR